MMEENSPEKGCKWYFAPGINFSVGPTDAAGQNFDGSWESLIRECIQNSLDAVKDPNQPVRVNFAFKKLPMSNYQNFFELKDHIQACLTTFKEAAEKQYKPMLDFFQNISSNRKADIGYLQISDYNTRGMDYEKDNDSCNFSAFVRGLGVHGGNQEASGRGGSFGLGKSTIFRMSPFRTIFVSTVTEQMQYVFEGVSSLTTHRMNGTTLSHIGYYDNSNGYPITDKDCIPARFIRKENENGIVLSGTDIYVMGRSEAEGDIDEIIKYVLTHYWLSIFKNKLIVSITDNAKNTTILFKANLDTYMKKIFPSPIDNGKNNLNPRPYYDAVAMVNTTPTNVLIEKELPSLGKVELYLSRNRDAKTDRIACFRMPCMMVMRKSTAQLRLGINSYGLYGAFVCKDDKGDRLLKQLENPAHNDWHEKHWRDPLSGNIESQAKAVMEELRNFLASEIDEFCKVKGNTTLKMLGAGKYLYTVQDIVEDDQNDSVLDDERGILVTDNFTEQETGARGTDVDENVPQDYPTPPIGMRHGNITNMSGKATPKGASNNPGGVQVMVTPPKKQHKKTNIKNVGGTKVVDGTNSNDPAAVVVPVDFKIYAEKQNGKIIHNVCIITTVDVESALINLTSKREDGKVDTELEIIDSFGIGSFKNMELRNVRLTKGNNLLKLQFNDNTKHSFTVNVKRQ